MTDDNGPTPPHEPVGSVGEEALKLFGALSDWAREHGSDLGDSASHAAGAFAGAVRDVNEHVATGAEDCRFCPVCQAIHAVRSTSPEVKAHLSVAASSLLQAAAELLATHVPGQQQSPATPVQKIDLDDTWDESPAPDTDGPRP